jgi:hypothetical protein
MPSRARRHKDRNETKASVDQVLNTLFLQAKAQFGEAVKSFCFYDSDLCPGCMGRAIDAMKIRGKEALSLNA